MPRSAAATARLDGFAANAAEVAALLKALANDRRLAVLCRLAAEGEANAGALAEGAGLSQSALSQHLAKLRAEGIVAFRREQQTLWYRIADPRIRTLMATLQKLYCPARAPGGSAR
jgi:ArsR family transcriptional regulator